jgi:hypothetical protein
LREADYLSNEESLKGIYYATDVMSPAYTALVRSGRVVSSVTAADNNQYQADIETAQETTTRNQLMREIGKYLFYKKRYAARQINASIVFNPFLAPGFSCVFLDDSEAGQSFIAKLQGVHHNLTHEGFTTRVELAYGRDFDEIDFMSGGSGDPPLPAWFDNTTYGYVDTSKEYFNLETEYLKSQTVINKSEIEFRNKQVVNPTVYRKLSAVYQSLLGSNAITAIGPEPKKKGDVREALVTTRGAVQHLVAAYKYKPDQRARDIYVRQQNRRPIPTMKEAMEFIGAQVVTGPHQKAGQIPDEFALFVSIKDAKRTGLPGRFDGAGFSDELILKLRRDVIDKYVRLLKTKRGFRG